MYHFHPDITNWFTSHFSAPTPVQEQAWQHIAKKHHVLISAPTGSGKTLAAFLHAINQLWLQADAGQLKQQTHVLYISPLKALSNDIKRNLQKPLEQLYQAKQDSLQMPITAQVRSGDTSAYERQKMLKYPPHILVTTPESLYILLTSVSGRELLSTIESVIVDEIHALINTKRGAHLSLSLERLEGLCKTPLQRIGISATQKPLDEVAAFLLGNRPKAKQHVEIINTGHNRKRDLDLCLPSTALTSIASGEQFSEIYDDIAHQCQAHRTTLIFVNTRRQCERVAKALAQRLGEDNVAAHHGSLAKEHRLEAETRLKNGQLKALVATAALELGIDIGEIELVIQIGSPRGINAFLQRVGRSGHSIDGVPKGRLFPLTRDDLVECCALLKAISNGTIDRVHCYPAALDVLAQQIVAEVAAREQQTLSSLFQWITQAHGYRNLSQQIFHDVIEMLADVYSTKRGRRSAYLHFDRVHQIVRARRGARLTAITNGGTIPDQFDYDVILQPHGYKIGTLNEDFSFESLPGDIFQLGNQCYQIEKVETGKVYVHTANGLPPNIPFWFGEAPGRTDELSHSVSALRQEFNHQMTNGLHDTQTYFKQHYALTDNAAEQLCQYLASAYHALGLLPTQNNIVIERFFDDAYDQHIVIHSCYGSAINKAWGLALRKRFCRQFNFELQAAALEDSIILSLSSTHSFDLDEVAHYVKKNSVEHVLTQALLDAPMFPTHWRWNATTALAVRRFTGGKKNPPQFQRSDAEDLVAVVFPDQIACLENIAGERDIPSHPLIQQTLYDCLNELMDLEGLKTVLERIENKTVKWHSCDVNAPSLLAEEVLSARPYAFLDDGNAEERRSSLVKKQQFSDAIEYSALTQLDENVITQISEQVWPAARDIEECHEALCLLGCVHKRDIIQHHLEKYIASLIQQKRASYFTNGFYVAAERVSIIRKVYPNAHYHPVIDFNDKAFEIDALDAIVSLLRMRFQCHAVLSEQQLSEMLLIPLEDISKACLALQQQGFILPCKVKDQPYWCERAILARIRRQSIRQKRQQNPTVSIAQFMQFLCQWQGIGSEHDYNNTSPDALLPILQQLDGYSAQAQSFEQAIFPTRLSGYMSYYLDLISQDGGYIWYCVQDSAQCKKQISKQSQVRLCQRQHINDWRTNENSVDITALSSRAQKLYQLLQHHGAQYYSQLQQQLGGLKSDTERALSELAANGFVSSDNFAGLRILIETEQQRKRKKRSRFDHAHPLERAGRWWLLPKTETANDNEKQNWPQIEMMTRALLKRYGVLCKALLINETALPKWRDMHYILRRMEAREEVLGGRFIDGVAGEHFALPESIALLRQCAKHPNQDIITVNACDPLNLTGSALVNPSRVAANASNKLLLYAGELINADLSGEIKWFVNADKFTNIQQQQFQRAYLQAARQSRVQKPIHYR